MVTKFAFNPESLLGRVQDHETANHARVSAIVELADRLMEAARKIDESWSGSCMGYHHELYYDDFKRPPLQDRFNVEWGGINGLPPGWRARQPDEVKTKVEALANAQFSLLEKEDKELSQSVDNLRNEIVTELALLRKLADLENEKDLLKELEALEWGDKERNEYVNSTVRSSPHATRDSGAIMAGFRIPAHIYYEGVAHGARKHCEAVGEFWKTAKRLLKQLQTQVADTGITEKGKGMNPLNTVKELLKRFHLVARQLTERHKQRPTLEIHDEYDLQDLLHALLRLHFDDIRPEEWAPSYGGGASRMDFLLKKEQVVVEAKMTRSYFKTLRKTIMKQAI
jgi:hypothetical protein